MTHVFVTRALFVVVGGLLAAALAFGLFVTRTRPPADADEIGPVAAGANRGEALYATYCGACHDLDFSVQYVRAAPSVDAGAAALADLLKNHGSASEPDNAVIVSYVKERASESR